MDKNLSSFKQNDDLENNEVKETTKPMSIIAPPGIIIVPLKESSIWLQMLIGFVTVVKATVGTGILFAPSAIIKSGYASSIILLLLYWIFNIICTLLLFECADRANDTYSGIASTAMGITGRILADVSLIFTEVSFCTVFVTFVTKAIQNVISGIKNCEPSYIEYGTALITFIQLIFYIPLSCFGRIQSLGPVVIMANIALCIGLIIVFVYAALQLASNIANNTVYNMPYFTNSQSVAGFIGTAAFLWVSGPVVLSYYVSIAEYNARKRFKWVYLSAASFLFVLTLTFTFVSAFAYGDNTFSTITLNLPISAGSMTGQLFFAFSILLSFPLMLFPVKEIFTKYIDSFWKKRNKDKILEFTVPENQIRQLSIQKIPSKIDNSLIILANNSPLTDISSKSTGSKFGSKILLRQPSGSISFTVKYSDKKFSYYFIKATPSLVMILISILCCIFGYFTINSLGNFVNLVGGLFCVPINIILPALFHLTIFRRETRKILIIMDLLLIVSGLITAIVVIWYTFVSWSTSNESICNLNLNK